MKHINYILAAIVAGSLAIPAAAVTDKEMEEARTITAKAYLRYANNGSGYLDDVNAKTMSELTPKLKAKELENLKAFNSVAVPKDYAKWDKEKLVEFWSVTFFTSPALDANGKVAKARVKKQISAMTISAPAPQAAEEPKPDAAPQQAQPDVQPADTAVQQMPDAAAAAAEQENILNDQQAIAEDAREAEQAAVHKEQSHTWVYILVLAVLVGLIVWLVIYAANLMKRQPGAGSDDGDSEDMDQLREQTRKAIAKKNEELAQVQERLRNEEAKSAQLGMEVERLKRDLRRQDDELTRLRSENMHRVPEPRQPQPSPERRAAAPADKPVLKVIYLGRANAKGIFVRADRRINPGNTIYRLDTNDGLVGTFHVVDEPEVVEVALSSPADYLGNGCSGENLEDTAGVTRIVTESGGTAIFENGYWKVLRKTRIRYE